MPIEEARCAFARFIRAKYGDEAADDRDDGIFFGREDGEDFIAGFLEGEEP